MAIIIEEEDYFIRNKRNLIFKLSSIKLLNPPLEIFLGQTVSLSWIPENIEGNIKVLLNNNLLGTYNVSAYPVDVIIPIDTETGNGILRIETVNNNNIFDEVNVTISSSEFQTMQSIIATQNTEFNFSDSLGMEQSIIVTQNTEFNNSFNVDTIQTITKTQNTEVNSSNDATFGQTILIEQTV
jgi:hypothetical protein